MPFAQLSMSQNGVRLSSNWWIVLKLNSFSLLSSLSLSLSLSLHACVCLPQNRRLYTRREWEVGEIAGGVCKNRNVLDKHHAFWEVAKKRDSRQAETDYSQECVLFELVYRPSISVNSCVCVLVQLLLSTSIIFFSNIQLVRVLVLFHRRMPWNSTKSLKPMSSFLCVRFFWKSAGTSVPSCRLLSRLWWEMPSRFRMHRAFALAMDCHYLSSRDTLLLAYCFTCLV